MAQRVFVDTNCFLHLRDFADLPWGELFPGQEIEILVAPVVIDELDRLKLTRDRRVRDRSRAALNQIEAASTEPGARLRLRAKPRAVWLAVAEAPRVDWSSFPRLDPTRADDQLVAAALSEPGSRPIVLLSFDAGPLIRARAAGLVAHRSPAAWALAPQTDATEREMARLQRDLAAARATRPSLIAQFVNAGESGDIDLLIPELPPLPGPVHSRLMSALQVRWPRSNVSVARRDPFDIRLSVGQITESQVARYREDYATFLEAAEQQIAGLHTLMALALRFGEVQCAIFNESQVTAANLRTGLSCSDGLHLFGHRSDMEDFGGALQRIKPPDPPSNAFEIPTIYETFHQLREPARDPTGLYWLQRPKGAPEAILTCDEFRPEQESQFSVYVFGPEAVAEGAVELHISATNLPQPIRVSGAIRFKCGPATWTTPAVLRRLPRWIAGVIEQELAGT